MSLPRYSDYKDAGVEWIGEIPHHWNIVRFKYMFKLSEEKNGLNPVGSMLSVSGYRGIEIKGYDDDNQKRTNEELSEYRIVHKGQLVVNTMWLNYTGLGVSEHEGYVSPAYRVYSVDLQLEKRFVHHLLRSSSYVAGYTKYLQGIRPNSLQIATDDFAVFPILVPPLSEQQAIAAFLDRETVRLDTLIEKQEKMIELLKRKRKAIINHAVTRGLNPNVPLKDSGVEWFGKIPAHWEVKRLGWLPALVQDIDHKMPESVEEGVLFLSAKDLLDDGTLNFTIDVKQISEDDYERLSRKVKPKRGDIIYSRIGAKLGKARLVETDERFLVSYSCCVIRVLNSEANTRFIRYILDSDLVLTEARLRTQGIGVPDHGLDQISRFPIPLPPDTEQELIVDFLDCENRIITALINKAQASIDLLNEHRASLISAAVTGKIDVRGL